VRLDIRVQDLIRTPMGRPGIPAEGPTQFLQLRASYHVTGRAGDRQLHFTALGSAETWRRAPDGDTPHRHRPAGV